MTDEVEGEEMGSNCSAVQLACGDSPSPDPVSAARAALAIACKELSGVQSERSEAKRQAEGAVDARFRTLVAAAHAAVWAAERKLGEAMDQLPDHPCTGKRVFRMVPTGRSYQHLPDKRVEGVVETRRTNTVFAANVGAYRRPPIGGGFVRLLKKDGSPGLQFDALEQSWRPWTLVEDPPEQPTTSPASTYLGTPAAEPQSGERTKPSENTHAE